MKITLSINSEHSIEVANSELAYFLFFSNDNPSRADFYNELASHPASQIRAEVASKTCLPVTTLEKLANDHSIEVVKKVACNETALKLFKAETLKSMLDRDASIAFDLAQRHLHSMKPAVRELVEAELMKLKTNVSPAAADD